MGRMTAVGILVQRGASVVVVTAGAYLWQLYQESTLSASSEVALLQADVISSVSSASELLWPPTQKSAPLHTILVLCFILTIKRVFFSGTESEGKKRVRDEKKRLLLAQMSMA